MSSVEASEYEYSNSAPTWDHGLILPPVLEAARAVPADGLILDIGCGNGAMLSELRRHGPWLLIGVESSQSGVAEARKNGIDARHSDGASGLTAMFEPHSFDLILSIEVIEHVDNPRGLLRQAHALLRPGGRLVLTTPYHGYVKNLMIAVLGKSDSHYNPLWDGGHIKFWSRKTILTALQEAGFVKIQFHGTGRLPFLWKSMVLTASTV